MSRPRILVVEDDHELRRTLERCLEREGCDVVPARDGLEALDKLDTGFEGELILTDLEMPRAGGEVVLQAGLKRHIPVVILTGHASVQSAVQMMRQGAANFLTKPFSPATLRALLEDTFGRAPGAVGAAALTPGPVREGGAVNGARASDGRAAESVIGRDPPFRRVIDVIQAVAETDATVLVSGESGTGKEVVARTIHASSRRARAPFVAVNCGAIPEPLLESELFGHARGAFTGATQSRAGRFQLADGGTLFLDEIGDMPLAFQVKLLRVLEDHRYEVLGEGVARPIDVRVIAATHRDLPRLVAAGSFREDLFYRLNVIDLQLPPLRDRLGDIPLLVDHFLAASNARHGRACTVSGEVLEALAGHGWPGNIRELANVVERMVVLKRSGEIRIGDLPPQLGGAAPACPSAMAALPARGLDLRQVVADLEQSLIAQALSRTGGNRNAAAQLLGLNRTTLVEKLRRRGKRINS